MTLIYSFFWRWNIGVFHFCNDSFVSHCMSVIRICMGDFYDTHRYCFGTHAYSDDNYTSFIRRGITGLIQTQQFVWVISMTCIDMTSTHTLMTIMHRSCDVEIQDPFNCSTKRSPWLVAVWLVMAMTRPLVWCVSVDAYLICVYTYTKSLQCLVYSCDVCV